VTRCLRSPLSVADGSAEAVLHVQHGRVGSPQVRESVEAELFPLLDFDDLLVRRRRESIDSKLVH